MVARAVEEIGGARNEQIQRRALQTFAYTFTTVIDGYLGEAKKMCPIFKPQFKTGCERVPILPISYQR